ncbi:CoA pyrophosphatase [Vibrio salinus]|uniref:CoA pyrophosphatase n=1 Tax=Vibrio salinus TaxID=2899784 RepID=UPI001E61368E|nr:CoA pyrophosphatase [Vibrio salinus]MCE0492448.1 CoA pyrophosphatase [Vibrio salinus]
MNTEQIITHFQLTKTQPYERTSLRSGNNVRNRKLYKAAVLIGFIDRNNRSYILFTKRADHLRHHPGQVCFPGGKFEDDDHELSATALRETYEEIGITPENITIFGFLPELTTGSGFSVTPVLAKLSSSFQLNIDRNEVSDVFEVPVDYVLNRHNLQIKKFRVNNSFRHVFMLPYYHYLIWGATGQIIDSLQRQLLNLTGTTPTKFQS